MDLSKSAILPQDSQEAILEDIRKYCEKDKALQLFKELIHVFYDEINVLIDKIKDKDVILDFYQDQAVSLSYGMQVLVDHLNQVYGPENVDLDGSKALNLLMKGISNI